MLILEIAAGIILGVIGLCLLPILLVLAAILVGLVIAAFDIYVFFNWKEMSETAQGIALATAGIPAVILFAKNLGTGIEAKQVSSVLHEDFKHPDDPAEGEE